MLADPVLLRGRSFGIEDKTLMREIRASVMKQFVPATTANTSGYTCRADQVCGGRGGMCGCMVVHALTVCFHDHRLDLACFSSSWPSSYSRRSCRCSSRTCSASSPTLSNESSGACALPNGSPSTTATVSHALLFGACSGKNASHYVKPQFDVAKKMVNLLYFAQLSLMALPLNPFGAVANCFFFFINFKFEKVQPHRCVASRALVMMCWV